MGRFPSEGRQRAVIENVTPEIDGGRFAIKRVVGETVTVEADIFSDGHDLLGAVLKHRSDRSEAWTEISMEPLGNDRWGAVFSVGAVGRYYYTIEAWIDRFGTWRQALEKKIAAGQNVSSDLLIGAALLQDAARRAEGSDKEALKSGASRLRSSA